jgi:hypothetical protein
MTGLADFGMMGRLEAPAQPFHGFDLVRHVPPNHMLREIDLFLDGDGLRDALSPLYSPLERSSIDPELRIRMFVIGDVMGIRSERRLRDEVHLNVAYRWFCRQGLEGKRFGIRPDGLPADTAYGNAENLGRRVETCSIIPLTPVIGKSELTDSTWSRSEFEWDKANDQHICPEGHALDQYRQTSSDPNRRQTGLKPTCQACPSKEICCPTAEAPHVPRGPDEQARKLARDCRKTKA